MHKSGAWSAACAASTSCMHSSSGQALISRMHNRECLGPTSSAHYCRQLHAGQNLLGLKSLGGGGGGGAQPWASLTNAHRRPEVVVMSSLCCSWLHRLAASC